MPCCSRVHKPSMAANATRLAQVASAIAGPALSGPRPRSPVTLMKPVSAWASGSMPGRPAYGPSWPKALTEMQMTVSLWARVSS